MLEINSSSKEKTTKPTPSPYAHNKQPPSPFVPARLSSPLPPKNLPHPPCHHYLSTQHSLGARNTQIYDAKKLKGKYWKRNKAKRSEKFSFTFKK